MKYEHTYVFHRALTGSYVRITVQASRRDPAVFVEGFDGFEIKWTYSRELT